MVKIMALASKYQICAEDAYMDVGALREQDAEAAKRGFISAKSAKVIDEIGIDPDDWLKAPTFGRIY